MLSDADRRIASRPDPAYAFWFRALLDACGADGLPVLFEEYGDHLRDGHIRVGRDGRFPLPPGSALAAVRRPATVTLWRPTGPEELELVRRTGWRRWPPRLPDQPIFHPVLNEDYAARIARDGNVPASGIGHVTRFDVDADWLSSYDVHQVGGESILEYWIPAEDLEDLNDHIVGGIREVVRFERAGADVVETRVDGRAARAEARP